MEQRIEQRKIMNDLKGMLEAFGVWTTKESILVWTKQLSAFSADAVANAVEAWAHTRTAAPASPKDFALFVQELAADKAEQQESFTAENPVSGKRYFLADEWVPHEDDHWFKQLMARYESGEQLMPCQVNYLSRAVGKKLPLVKRFN